MIITLRSHLARLEDEERFKPEAQRRPIPTIQELADAAGVSRVQMQRVVSGNISSLKLSVASGVIKLLRERGFNTDVGSILEYRD
jgi:hypothetical protein